jgi:tRNA(Ile)-lysidine synthetase-like protein
VIDSELLFHPLDEVTVIEPEAFERDHPELKEVEAISKEEFKEVAEKLGLANSDGIVACISGGPDSMAMARLLADYCTDNGLSLLCVTVDHALRPEAPAEALVTQGWLHELGVPHVIARVEWNGNVPTHGIQSKARDARYQAITDIATELQMRLSSPTSTALIQVLMAHTADDNIETFWLRMAGCSGSYGLAGIAETRSLRPKISLIRPLLTFPKRRLYATLIAAKQPWALDPSNEKLLYRRNQVRHILESIYDPAIAEPGSHTPLPSKPLTYLQKTPESPLLLTKEEEDNRITLADLQSIQLHFSKARYIIDSISHRFCTEYVSLSKKYGYVVVPTLALLHTPELFAFRILDNILAHVSGSGVPTRLKSLRSALQRIRSQSEVIDADYGQSPIRDSKADLLAQKGSKTNPICIHGCIIVQTRHKLTITMQNVPNAPASLCGDTKPLPPYRADEPVKLGSTLHWMNSWRVDYHIKPSSSLPDDYTLSHSEQASNDLASFPPKQLYIRQIQPTDFTTLRQLAGWNVLSRKLTRETILALPIIVDENSNIVHCPFLPGLPTLPENPSLASAKIRYLMPKLATLSVHFDPKHSLNDPPSSSFVGYDTFKGML